MKQAGFAFLCEKQNLLNTGFFCNPERLFGEEISLQFISYFSVIEKCVKLI